MRRRRLLGIGLGLAGAPLAGCPGRSAAPTTTTRDTTTVGSGPARPTDTERRHTARPAGATEVGYTHVQPTGNRVLPGRGSLPETPAVDYPLPAAPAWLTALPRGTDSRWAVATADGHVHLLTVTDGDVTDERQVASLPAGRPFAVTDAADPRVLAGPGDAARWSHAVPTGDGRLLYVDDGGDVVLAGDSTRRESVGALPDARIVRVTPGRYALLGGRTRRYDHGALGDEYEGGRIVLVDVRDGLSVRTPLEVDPPRVIEGIAPIAADLTGDGRRDLVVTVAGPGRGARHVAVSLDGMRLATGPAFETGFRWRHALAVAPFGPDGGTELAGVRTPHIGGAAKFYRRRGDDLAVVASVEGVSSHALGSRNLDGGLGGDLDGDGNRELLVPTQERDELVGIRRVAGGAEVAWRLELPGTLASNVTGVTLADGSVAVGAAGADGAVRLWHP